MQRLWCWGCSFLFVFLACAPAGADLGPISPRPPRPAPKPAVAEKFTAPVVIKHGEELGPDKAVVAKISIPRSLVALKPLPARPNAREGGALGLDLRTVLAGIFLSGAAVCGLMLMRGSRVAKISTAGCLVAALVFGAWSMAGANAPPPELRAKLVEEAKGDGKVLVEFVGDTDTVTIQLAK